MEFLKTFEAFDDEDFGFEVDDEFNYDSHRIGDKFKDHANQYGNRREIIGDEKDYWIFDDGTKQLKIFMANRKSERETVLDDKKYEWEQRAVRMSAYNNFASKYSKGDSLVALTDLFKQKQKADYWSVRAEVNVLKPYGNGASYIKKGRKKKIKSIDRNGVYVVGMNRPIQWKDYYRWFDTKLENPFTIDI